MQSQLWYLYFRSKHFSYLPFIDTIDFPLHRIYLAVSVRNDFHQSDHRGETVGINQETAKSSEKYKRESESTDVDQQQMVDASIGHDAKESTTEHNTDLDQQQIAHAPIGDGSHKSLTEKSTDDGQQKVVESPIRHYPEEPTTEKLTDVDLEQKVEASIRHDSRESATEKSTYVDQEQKFEASIRHDSHESATEKSTDVNQEQKVEASIRHYAHESATEKCKEEKVTKTNSVSADDIPVSVVTSEKIQNNEISSLSQVFFIDGKRAEIVYAQIDEDAVKDIFLSSLISEWRSPNIQSDLTTEMMENGFDFVIYMECSLENMQENMVCTVQENLYKDASNLRDIAIEALKDEKYATLLVIDLLDVSTSEGEIVQKRSQFIFPNSTVLIVTHCMKIADAQGKMHPCDRVVDIYRKDADDIVAATNECLRSYGRLQDSILTCLIEGKGNDIRWEGFLSDPIIMSLLISTSMNRNIENSITHFLISSVDHLIQNTSRKGRDIHHFLKGFRGKYECNRIMEMYMQEFHNFAKFMPILMTLGSLAFERIFGKEFIRHVVDDNDRTVAVRFGIEIGLLKNITDNYPSTEIKFTHNIFRSLCTALWMIEIDTGAFIELQATKFETMHDILSHKLLLTLTVGLGIQSPLGRCFLQPTADLSVKDTLSKRTEKYSAEVWKMSMVCEYAGSVRSRMEFYKSHKHLFKQYSHKFWT